MSEVAGRAAALHRCSKLLSAILPRKIRFYAVADRPLFVAPQPVNPSFSCLAGAAAVGSKRLGSVTFTEMECLGRFFRCQLEATSSSLWLMSGILAMLRRSASTPPPQASSTWPLPLFLHLWRFLVHTAASGSAFLRSKRRESLLEHSKVPIPVPQKHALIVTPGSVTGLFDEPLLHSVAAHVKEDSLVSSSLAVSKALSSRSGSKTLATSSSPLAGPSGYRPPCPGQRSGPSLRSGGRMRFKGGKESARSLKASGVRKWEPSPCITLSGGCLSLHWQAWRDRGAVPWVVEVLREGYRIPFLRPPPLSMELIPMPSYGAALEEVTLALIAKGAVELAPLLSPGFSGRRFVVWKTSGVVASGHRPVPAHSIRGHFPLSPGNHPVCSHVSPTGGLDGLRLREAYLQVPVHPESRRFLCFVAHGRTYQLKALCFSLSTAPQVFPRVMAPVSVVLLSLGIRMRHYRDDWLVQAS